MAEQRLDLEGWDDDTGEATYCPEDNKLRLYVGRVDRETYDRLRKAGYKSTPKQSCDFVATWTVAREDLARELIGGDDIGDEDQSPQDRAADRAERFLGYQGKRLGEAVDHADTFDTGPAVHGYQDERKAERAARRHNRQRVKAVSQWGKAEYWQRRTEGVISNALYKSSPGVRRGRILRLEAEQRKHLSQVEAGQKNYDAWSKVPTLDGADELLPIDESGWPDTDELKPAQKLAYLLSNNGGSGFHAWHPTSEEVNEKFREVHTDGFWSRYGFDSNDLLRLDEYYGVPMERLTPRQAAELYLAKYRRAGEDGSHSDRVTKHFELRLAYERQMMKAEGGSADLEEIKPGGWYDGLQVEKVNKSNATKRPVSLVLWTSDGKHTRHNIQRDGDGRYTPPTAEDLEQLKQRRAERKAKQPKSATPKLVNPTREHAERLQAIWNESAQHPSEVWEMTQAEYSARSKGSYGACETAAVTERGVEFWSNYMGDANGTPMFKVRKGCPRGAQYGSARRVVVLTDKPQKPIPWDAMAEEFESYPTVEELIPKLPQMQAELGKAWWRDVSEEGQKLFEQFRYHGLVQRQSASQFGFTEAGHALLSEAAA